MFPLNWIFPTTASIIGFVHDLVSIDGNLANPADARLEAVSRAALYGAGVFTTIAIYDGEPFLWDKHWRRLDSNSTVIGIDLSGITKTIVKRSLRSLLDANHVTNGRARITLFDRSRDDAHRAGFESKERANRKVPGDSQHRCGRECGGSPL